MLKNLGSVDKAVIWQDVSDDYSVGEPALLVSAYSDVICIKQSASGVNINYETIPELIRLLRDIHKGHKPKQAAE